MIHLFVLFTLMFQDPSVYDYSFTSMDGNLVQLSDFKGKPILIINTASKCGFTKQYQELQELHERFGKDVVVIGFPSDNFGGQELESNEDIQAFCQENYGVTFLLSEKVDVKGENAIPLFQYLTKAQNSDFTGDIKWNFEKFVINPNGKLVHRYRSKTTPLDKEIISALGK